MGISGKAALAIGVSAIAPAALIYAHDRVFLAAQPREQRVSRTWLTAGEMSGTAAAASLAAAVMTRGANPQLARTLALSGGAVVAGSLLSAAFSTATDHAPTAARPPFGRPLETAAKVSPPVLVRSGEMALAGGLVGGLLGGIATRSLKPVLRAAGLGALAGAVGGAAVFSVIGADR